MLAVVVGCVLLTVGLVMLFVRSQLLSDTGLRDRSLTALDKPVIRERLSVMVTEQVRERVPVQIRERVPSRVIARAVDRAIDQPAFRSAFGSAVKGARDVLMDQRHTELRLPLREISAAIGPRLAEIDPRIAEQARGLRNETILITQNSDLESVARTINLAKLLGLLLPITAALCFLLALLVARRRANAAAGVGIAVLIAGITVVITSRIGRSTARSMVNDADSDVAEAVWTAFAGSLSTWGIVTAVMGAGILVLGLATRLVSGRNRHLSHT